jgi:hypothetical protein
LRAWSILLHRAGINAVYVAQAVSRVVSITNCLNTTVEASLRPGSCERYTLHPQQIRLKPGQTTEVEIKLKVTRFAQVEKAVEQGQRDTFHIKTPYFDQKFTATFFLSPQLLSAAPSSAAPYKRPSVLREEDPPAAGLVLPSEGDGTSTERRAHVTTRVNSCTADADASQQRSLLNFRMPASPAALPPREASSERKVRPLLPVICSCTGTGGARHHLALVPAGFRYRHHSNGSMRA